MKKAWLPAWHCVLLVQSVYVMLHWSKRKYAFPLAPLIVNVPVNKSSALKQVCTLNTLLKTILQFPMSCRTFERSATLLVIWWEHKINLFEEYEVLTIGVRVERIRGRPKVCPTLVIIPDLLKLKKKLENFQLQNLFPTENLCPPSLLLFLSTNCPTQNFGGSCSLPPQPPPPLISYAYGQQYFQFNLIQHRSISFFYYWKQMIDGTFCVIIIRNNDRYIWNNHSSWCK